MATKNIYETTATIDILQRYTVAGADILTARQLCASLENDANTAYAAAVKLANMEYNNTLENISSQTRGSSVRAASLKRDAAIDAATKERDAAIDKARKAFNQVVKDARDRQNNVLKLVSGHMYAAMLYYNNTGTISAGGWTVETRVTGKSHNVEKRTIFVEKSLVECFRDTLAALEFNRVNDNTVERWIRKAIVNVSGTRSRGAAGNYTRRGMTRDGYRRETVEFIINSLTAPRYEYRRETVDSELRETIVTVAPRWRLDNSGHWSRNN